MKMTRSVFDLTWKRLADEGKVASWEGEEYTRVLGEWRVKGYPAVTEEWIVARAAAKSQDQP